MNEFNYKDSLNGIKASLFDIYEDQEQQIGLEQNPKIKNARLNKFIEVKDIALMLIEGINYLYDDIVDQTSILKDKLENPKMPLEIEESKILDMVENSNIEGINKENDNVEIPQEEVNDEEIEFNEEDSVATEDNIDQEKLKRYYLDCDIEDVNFAYVPQSLYEKIKKNKAEDDVEIEFDDEIKNSQETEQEEIFEDKIENTNQGFMKQDTEKPRGIIVRSDQYMKLALSKHRQEGVLEEAKKYRIEEVKRRRKEEQKRELEKAEVKIDI